MYIKKLPLLRLQTTKKEAKWLFNLFNSQMLKFTLYFARI